LFGYDAVASLHNGLLKDRYLEICRVTPVDGMVTLRPEVSN
jgi:hypothetical protein